MSTPLPAENFLKDYIFIIREQLSKTRQKCDNEYDRGRVFAYYDILSILQMQAQSFEIDLDKIGLDYELTNELLLENQQG